MIKDKEAHIMNCDHPFTSKISRKAAMENIQTTHPLELVHLDCLTSEATEGVKNVNTLVITDHFILYAQALVTLSETAKCTAQAL